MAAGAEAGDALCVRAVELFVEALAGALRDAALHLLPDGGLFLAGGIAPRLAKWIKAALHGHFVNDPVMGGFVNKFPISLVTNDDLGLLGARERARRLMLE